MGMAATADSGHDASDSLDAVYGADWANYDSPPPNRSSSGSKLARGKDAIMSGMRRVSGGNRQGNNGPSGTASGARNNFNTNYGQNYHHDTANNAASSADGNRGRQSKEYKANGNPFGALSGKKLDYIPCPDCSLHNSLDAKECVACGRKFKGKDCSIM